MAKRILAICAALIAFAAVPAVASASPELQTSGGVKVAVNTGLKATNEGNVVLTTALGNITCEKAELGGEVTENSGTSIKATVSTASFTSSTGGRCPTTISDLIGGTLTVRVTTFTTNELTPNNTEHWCITSTKLGVGSIVGGPCGTPKSLKFQLDLFRSNGTLAGSCIFERASVEGTYNTSSSPLILSTGEKQVFKLTASEGTFCPSEATLDAKFKIQTTTGGELRIV